MSESILEGFDNFLNRVDDLVLGVEPGLHLLSQLSQTLLKVTERLLMELCLTSITYLHCASSATPTRTGYHPATLSPSDFFHPSPPSTALSTKRATNWFCPCSPSRWGSALLFLSQSVRSILSISINVCTLVLCIVLLLSLFELRIAVTTLLLQVLVQLSDLLRLLGEVIWCLFCQCVDVCLELLFGFF